MLDIIYEFYLFMYLVLLLLFKGELLPFILYCYVKHREHNGFLRYIKKIIINICTNKVINHLNTVTSDDIVMCSDRL